MADITPAIAVEVQFGTGPAGFRSYFASWMLGATAPSGGGGTLGGWVDITGDVVCAMGIHVRRGIRGSGPLDLVATPGTAVFVLRNDAHGSNPLGYYSLWNANKRAGWDLGIGCRIRLTDPATGIVHTVFRGRIDKVLPVPGVKLERRVEVTAVDWIEDASKWSLAPEVGQQTDKRGDEVLQAILDAMPSSPIATDLEPGSDVYPIALQNSVNAKTPALSEFASLAASEQGPIYVKADGTLRYENRHTRLLASLVWTLTDTELRAQPDALQMPSSRSEILNKVLVTTHSNAVDVLPNAEVYRQTNPIRINAGETQFLLGSFQDPMTGEAIGAVDVQPQVPGVDYQFFSDPSGTGTDLSADLVVTVTAGPSGARFSIENTGVTDGYLTRNVLYGRAVRDRGAITKESTNDTSIARYGENPALIDAAYQADPAIGQAMADFKLAQFGDPSAQVRSITVFGKTPALLTQILTRDISDKIEVQETVTGANGEYFINGVDLTILPSGHVVATYITAPAIDPGGGNYWVLGVSTLGVDTIPAPF